MYLTIAHEFKCHVHVPQGGSRVCVTLAMSHQLNLHHPSLCVQVDGKRVRYRVLDALTVQFTAPQHEPGQAVVLVGHEGHTECARAALSYYCTCLCADL